jgi:hypothetical protein
MPAAGSTPAEAPAPSPVGKYRGTASCASTACHNGNEPSGSTGSEYTTWANKDRHARAYEVLFNATSRQIIKQLGEAKPAHQNVRCLNCHVHPGSDAFLKDEREASRFLADGVGCEACHGPAEKWLTAHYAPEWKDVTPAKKKEFGMRDTKDLVTRAEVCVTCHVGGADGDVNHDLIAAGHPRLSFEYAAYHANLPKHWPYAKEVKDRPDIEAELWLIGQAVSARAALKLLEHRAADKEKPWPEFAEYDCFACHHDLSDQAWRREEKRVKGRLGKPAWGTWYFALGDVVAGKDRAFPEKSVEELCGLMATLRPDCNEVGAKAGEAAKALDGWLPALRENKSREVLPGLATDLEKARGRLDDFGWDGAAQLYLGLAAQHPQGAQKEFLLRLRKQLEFRPGYQSPKGFAPPGPNQPDGKPTP